MKELYCTRTKVQLAFHPSPQQCLWENMKWQKTQQYAPLSAPPFSSYLGFSGSDFLGNDFSSMNFSDCLWNAVRFIIRNRFWQRVASTTSYKKKKIPPLLTCFQTSFFLWALFGTPLILYWKTAYSWLHPLPSRFHGCLSDICSNSLFQFLFQFKKFLPG